mmetsp:Transcript_8415/g.23176  ORF Transcript_8415/g.23176 Transcript_8415/m.23176 type:complete len:254 (-) Transcript_8415:31-792(-)
MRPSRARRRSMVRTTTSRTRRTTRGPSSASWMSASRPRPPATACGVPSRVRSMVACTSRTPTRSSPASRPPMRKVGRPSTTPMRTRRRSSAARSRTTWRCSPRKILPSTRLTSRSTSRGTWTARSLRKCTRTPMRRSARTPSTSSRRKRVSRTPGARPDRSRPPTAPSTRATRRSPSSSAGPRSQPRSPPHRPSSWPRTRTRRSEALHAPALGVRCGSRVGCADQRGLWVGPRGECSSERQAFAKVKDRCICS